MCYFQEFAEQVRVFIFLYLNHFLFFIHFNLLYECPICCFWFVPLLVPGPFERAFLTLNIIILNGAFHLQTWSMCSSFSVLFYVRACVFCVFFSEKEIPFLWLKIPAQRVGRTARFITLSCMSCFPSSDHNRVHLKQVNLLTVDWVLLIT